MMSFQFQQTWKQTQEKRKKDYSVEVLPTSGIISRDTNVVFPGKARHGKPVNENTKTSNSSQDIPTLITTI